MTKKISSQEEYEDKYYLFCHSACCGAHWELIYNKATKRAFLSCEKCGSIGPDVKLDHNPEKCECCDNDHCEKENEEDE